LKKVINDFVAYVGFAQIKLSNKTKYSVRFVYATGLTRLKILGETVVFVLKPSQITQWNFILSEAMK